MIYLKLSNEEVRNLIPHRPPFLMVDEVLECEPGKSVTAIKHMPRDEWFYKGHFPEFPITPGVITLECMAQAVAVPIALMEGNAGRIAFFAGAKDVRFKRKIFPDSTITLKCTVRDPGEHIMSADCKAFVNGEEAASAVILFSFGK